MYDVGPPGFRSVLGPGSPNVATAVSKVQFLTSNYSTAAVYWDDVESGPWHKDSSLTTDNAFFSTKEFTTPSFKQSLQKKTQNKLCPEEVSFFISVLV